MNCLCSWRGLACWPQKQPTLEPRSPIVCGSPPHVQVLAVRLWRSSRARGRWSRSFDPGPERFADRAQLPVAAFGIDAIRYRALVPGSPYASRAIGRRCEVLPEATGP
jgi:hypothetical protein